VIASLIQDSRAIGDDLAVLDVSQDVRMQLPALKLLVTDKMITRMGISGKGNEETTTHACRTRCVRSLNEFRTGRRFLFLKMRESKNLKGRK
jgi:hypothetical protein